MTSGPRPATRRVAMAVRRAFARHGGSLGIGRLVLAVSGGADSMAMLLASAEVGSRLRKRMVVAHFAHGLRPWADRREQALVRRTAADLGLPFEAGQGRTKPSEAAAREERYRFLGRIAAKYDAAGVLTAHTQDDQAETVLLRLTRGAGLRGAGAIRELSSRMVDGRGLTLLRPLLAVNRVETEAVCKEAGVSPARDASNRSLKYARNRVRLRVLRQLAELNPDVRAALAGFAERAAEDEELLEVLALEAVAVFEERSPWSIAWPKAELRRLPRPLLARVLESAWRSLQGEGATLGRRKLDQAALVIARGGKTSLGKGWSLTVGPGPMARIALIEELPIPPSAGSVWSSPPSAGES